MDARRLADCALFRALRSFPRQRSNSSTALTSSSAILPKSSSISASISASTAPSPEASTAQSHGMLCSLGKSSNEDDKHQDDDSDVSHFATAGRMDGDIIRKEAVAVHIDKSDSSEHHAASAVDEPVLNPFGTRVRIKNGQGVFAYFDEYFMYRQRQQRQQGQQASTRLDALAVGIGEDADPDQGSFSMTTSPAAQNEVPLSESTTDAPADNSSPASNDSPHIIPDTEAEDSVPFISSNTNNTRESNSSYSTDPIMNGEVCDVVVDSDTEDAEISNRSPMIARKLLVRSASADLLSESATPLDAFQLSKQTKEFMRALFAKPTRAELYFRSSSWYDILKAKWR
jgi:hypothetical protein